MKSIKLFLAIFFLFSAVVFPQAKTQQKSSPQSKPLKEVPKIDRVHAQWTGDLDGMQKRRLVRVLTVASKTFYFVDRGQPRGIVYD
jgi:hypothetical protein